MKLEIEVSENEISEAITRKARIAIAEFTNQSWLNDQFIKAEIKKFWSEAVTNIIKNEISNSEVIRQKVVSMIDAKLRGQIQALMKEKK